MRTGDLVKEHRMRRLSVTCLSCCLILVLGSGLLSGCRSRDQYKAKADEEVYKILQNKWQDQFGEMGNYQIGEPNVGITNTLPENGELALAEAVAMAVTYSREYQTQKESLYDSALNLTLTRHSYARRWFATVDADYALDNGSDDISASGTAGVTQDHLIGQGMGVATGLTMDWARFLTGDPRKSLGSVLTATITAPILGAGAWLERRETLTSGERNVLYAIRSFSRNRKSFVIGIIRDYYNVLQNRDSVAIQEASYKRLVDSTDQLRMEVEVGQAAGFGLAEAEQNLYAAENNLVTIRQNYERILDEFKIRLALPADVNITLSQKELTALEELGVSLPTYTEQDAIEMALDRRLDLANTVDALDDAGRKLELAAKGLGMQMDFSLSANASGTAPTQAARIQFHEGTYTAGLSANLPLDRKAERNAYVSRLISYNRQKRNLEEQIETVKLGVRQSYRDLAETAESHRIQQMGFKLAEKTVEVQKLSLQYGLSEVRLLLKAEDDLVSARNSVTRALVDHTVAKLNFFRDIGVLQVRPDGMWEQVTQ